MGALGQRPIAVGGGVADPLEIRSPPCYPAAFGRSRYNGTSVIKEIRAESLTHCDCVPPFKVTFSSERHGSIRQLSLPITVP